MLLHIYNKYLKEMVEIKRFMNKKTSISYKKEKEIKAKFSGFKMNHFNDDIIYDANRFFMALYGINKSSFDQ